MQKKCARRVAGWQVTGRGWFWVTADNAAAVGSQGWVERIAGRLPVGWFEPEPETALRDGTGDAVGTYVLRVSNRVREGLLGVLHR